MAPAPNDLVLIAYDGSDFAKAAVTEAGAQLGPGRRVLVLTVFEPLDKVPFLGVSGLPVEPQTISELFEHAEGGARRTAEEGGGLARQAGFGEVEAIASGGTPAWARIVEVADERDAGLIVIGSRGLSGVKHALLGSVASAVSQHSRRSVLIVHRH